MKFLSYRSQHFPAGVVGLVDGAEKSVTPLLFPNLADALVPGTPEELLADVQILAPLRGRDVLCVGKNYKEHAAEFHNSGYDSSDKQAQPEFPVIFTKRATSIVGHGAVIYPHPSVTQALDYEGELAIIIGKGGIGISKEEAWDHVWGACIVNDRDHKQFYIGKSLDTFCPMGPYAVPASQLDWQNMVLETKLNGETRQKQKTSELIFDIPTLIATCSMGITLQPGDVIATGTPAGVCLSHGKFLSPGDRVDITITGLGTLSNVVGDPKQPPPMYESVSQVGAYSPASELTQLPSGKLYVRIIDDAGQQAPTIVFVHGLGGSTGYYEPIARASGLAKTHRLVFFDLEGVGLSPPTGEPITIGTYAQSIKEVLDHVGAQEAVVVGHSMGGKLIANTFAAAHPRYVTKLFLIGPVKQLAEAGQKAMADRAALVRKHGMSAITSAIIAAGTASKTQSERPLVCGAVLSSLLAQPAEGYAQACLALGSGIDPLYNKITVPVFIVAGDEDKTSPKATVDFLLSKLPQAVSQTLSGVGHWQLLEDVEGTATLLKQFIG